MTTKRHGGCVFAALVFVLQAAAVSVAEEQQSNGEPIDQQIVAAQEARNRVAEQYNAIFQRIKNDDDVRRLDEAVTAAARELRAAEQTEQSLIDARQAEADAMTEFQDAVAQALGEHAEAGPLTRQAAQLQDESDGHEYEIQLARFQLGHELSPITRVLHKEFPTLSQLKQKAEAASGAKRNAALAAYQQAREARLAELEMARPLLEAVKQHEAAVARLDQERRALQAKLAPIRAAIESKHRAALNAARTAREQAANTGRLKQLREDHTKAVDAFNERFNELLQSDPEAPALRKQYDEWGAKIQQLKRRAKDSAP